MTDTQKIFDAKLALLRVAGKVEMAKTLFDMLLKTFDEDVKSIQEAHEQQDLTQLRQRIHKLHGGLCYTGLPSLEAIVAKIDQDLVKGNSATLDEDMRVFLKAAGDVLAHVDDIMSEFEAVPY